MQNLLATLKSRNIPLYYTGLFSLLAAAFCILMLFVSTAQVFNINAWWKPLKFFVSTAIFTWTMAWILDYLDEKRKIVLYSWVVVVILNAENLYIMLQASRGELSHFNISTETNGLIFALMGLAITVMTLWTAYICLLFFIKKMPKLPLHYLWSIRLGILIFVLSAFEGGLMAANLAHTVGAADGSVGLPITSWSRAHGDLRVAHFFGMHALQFLPLLGFYVFKNVKTVIAFAILYASAIAFFFFQALAGKPFISMCNCLMYNVQC